MTESQSRTFTSHYYAKVAFDDHAIGVVLQALRETGLMEDTWIVYTSDHGECLGARGIFGKFTLYDEAAAVPMIMAGPVGSGVGTIPTGAVLVDV